MINSSLTFFRPSIFLITLSGVLLLVYQIIPPDDYNALFWSSKVVSLGGMLFILSTVLLSATFAYIGERTKFSNKKKEVFNKKLDMYEEVNLPKWWIILSMLLCLLAYIIWFTVGIVRSGGPINLYNTYISNAFYVKEVLLNPIPGVTSFTQIGLIITPISILNKKQSKIEKILILLILLCALIRSFLFSERLALLEMIIPIMIVYASKLNMKKKDIVKGFGVFTICVLAFFIFNESRRSFSARGISSFLDVLSNGVFRFFGYYLTSINNYGLSVDRYEFKFPLFFTLSSLWNLPGLGWLYNDIFPKSSFDAPKILLANQLNPELNVFTTVGYWVMEYGLLTTLLIAAFYGFLSGLFFNFAKHSAYWLAFYSVWFIGILEFMRIYYIGSPRIFVPFVFFAITLLLRNNLSKKRI